MSRLPVLLLSAALAPPAVPRLPAMSPPPCVRLIRAGTQVQGDVRVCPGRYRIADPSEHGVLIAAASGTRIDLAGVTHRERRFRPRALRRHRHREPGRGRGHRTGRRRPGVSLRLAPRGRAQSPLSGIDLSGSRRPVLRSTPERARPRRTGSTPPGRKRSASTAAACCCRARWAPSVTGITAHGAQNGIGLVDANGSYVADNDLAGNTGWAVHLLRSSHNMHRPQPGVADPPVRSRAPDCGAAAVLLREGSDSNTIADNDLTGSSMGVLLTGSAPVTPALGRESHIPERCVIAARGRVRGARAPGAATFLDNRADSVGHRLPAGPALGRRRPGEHRHRRPRAGIEVMHGGDTGLEANVLLGGPVGIRVATPDDGRAARPRIRIDDNVLGGVEQGSRAARGNRQPGRGATCSTAWVTGWCWTAPGMAPRSPATCSCAPRAGSSTRPDLAAGGNYWATADASGAAARVRGGSACCPGNRRVRRATSDHLRREGVRSRRLNGFRAGAPAGPDTGAGSSLCPV